MKRVSRRAFVSASALVQPLGGFNLVIALLIATSRALIVAAVFMELRERNGVMIAFAGAGFFWRGILIWLSGTD